MHEANKDQAVPRRILASLVNALGAGVVPRSGAPYIAIGREKEIEAMLSDLSVCSEGGSAMRFIIGKYGSGKSFLLQLIRGYATERGFVTADADLSPERRFCGSSGSGLATYRELVRNMAVRSCPDGGALSTVLSRWISSLQSEAAASGMEVGGDEMRQYVQKAVYGVVSEMENSVGGFDFATAVNAWYTGYVNEDPELQSAAMRWLRGEYENRSQARAYLRVGNIINDDNWYDYLKLWAVFAVHIGYRGLAVFVDECVNLYKIPNRISRENNYEMILSMFNDALQGRAPGLALFLGGTPQFLEDPRRGLFSYEALHSRLSDGRYGADLENNIGPVIRLRRLSDDELFALICRLTRLHEQYYNWTCPVTDDERVTFLQMSLSRAGAEVMMTPRQMIRDYITVLNLLKQNPESDFASIVGITIAEQKKDTSQNGADGITEIEF